ncbi:hypothetical protein [Oleiagrimonas sp. MCCC 1A03011]|nr:hypothetical protein [Oleiagrimonas sp. MCCC 1A03011]
MLATFLLAGFADTILDSSPRHLGGLHDNLIDPDGIFVTGTFPR